VALTMHGWWWPGRQVVVVVPCLVLAVAWWAGQVPLVRRLVVAAGAIGTATWLWLVAEVLTDRRTLIADFEGTANPVVRLLGLVLPDYRSPGPADWALQTAWFAALAAAAVVACRAPSGLRRRGSGGPPAPGGGRPRTAAGRAS
jgi:hypothetical protein